MKDYLSCEISARDTRMKKPCKNCGRKFEAVGNMRFCRPDCRKTKDRERDRARDENPIRRLQKSRIGRRWHAANREEETARMHARYLANVEEEKAKAQEYNRMKREGQLVERTCRCGRSFWVPPNSQKWFCTHECRHRITYGVTVWLIKGLRDLERGKQTATLSATVGGKKGDGK
jgi:hypothetical protein